MLPHEIAFLLLLFSPKRTLLHKYYRAMKFTKRNIIPLLVFVLSFASIVRLVKISVTSSYSSPIFSALSPVEHRHSLLAEKEISFLFDLVSRKSPCKILVFRLETQYSCQIAIINSGGITVFLEDNPAIIKASNSTSNTNIARDAYKILKHARKNQKDCYISATTSAKHDDLHSNSSRKCKFMSLWDLVIVHGPDGDKPESPGRMAAIYIAGMLQEQEWDSCKWFSWEFLCDTNLVSSKGKFWDFNILAKPNATTFCPT
ncbi:unnamed protein product [Withania somnifera]